MPEVTLTTLSYGGDCLGRLPDGRVVFIPFGIPGEHVAIEILEDNRKYSRGKIIKIIESSPLRVEPRCRHFGQCGGCHLQHMAYEAQVRFKTDILVEQLKRVGKLTGLPAPEGIPSPKPYQYRNNMRFHVLKDGHLGFLAPHSERILPITECHLPEKVISDQWTTLSLEAESGIEQTELRCGSSEELLVTFEGGEESIPVFETDLAISAVHDSPAGRLILAGEDLLTIRVKERDFQVSGGSFFQVNTHQAGKMVELLQEHLKTSKQTTLMDLYCGVGLFSAFFAPLVREVIGVELSAEACRDFITNLDDFDNVSLYEGSVEKVLPGLPTPADTVILDPPRAGLHPKALAALMGMKPNDIAYISCDPATLARDLAVLSASGYAITRLFMLDMFPQTYHQETIAFLEYFHR